MSENIKHIVAILIVLMIGFGFYYLTKSDTIFNNHQQRSEEIAEETRILKSEIITPLRKLDNVKVDTDFFNSPEYNALKDSSEPLPKPKLHRDNPFAPVK